MQCDFHFPDLPGKVVTFCKDNQSHGKDINCRVSSLWSIHKHILSKIKMPKLWLKWFWMTQRQFNVSLPLLCCAPQLSDNLAMFLCIQEIIGRSATCPINRFYPNCYKMHEFCSVAEWPQSKMLKSPPPTSSLITTDTLADNCLTDIFQIHLFFGGGVNQSLQKLSTAFYQLGEFWSTFLNTLKFNFEINLC